MRRLARDSKPGLNPDLGSHIRRLPRHKRWHGYENRLKSWCGGGGDWTSKSRRLAGVCSRRPNSAFQIRATSRPRGAWVELGNE